MEAHDDERLPEVPDEDPESKTKEPDVLIVKQVGAVVFSFGIAEHDPFIDDLERGGPPDWYYEDPKGPGDSDITGDNS